MKSRTDFETVPAWRVVVIEDSPDDIAEIRRMLHRGSDRRYEFVEAATGAAGMRAVFDASGRLPDCVLLDYYLPDIEAPEVLQALIGPDGLTVCPVVVLTGRAGSQLGPSVLRAGAQDFIGKSWMTGESLTRAVENAAQRWAMARELHARTTALRASEIQLRLAADVAGMAVIRIDYRMDTVILDTIGAVLFGLQAGVPLPRSAIHAVFHPDDAAEIARQVDQCFDPNGDGSFAMEHRILHRDGSIRWIDVKKQLTFGEIAGVRRPVTGVLATIDITMRKQHEATVQMTEERLALTLDELRVADRRKDEFLATLAHELRNPLAPIRSGLSILRTARLPDQAEKVVEMMDRQLGHMVNLVDDLLDVSRVRTGSINLRLERVTVREVVDAAVEACRPMIEESSHTLEVDVTAEPMAVIGDNTRLVQIVTNLLTNAAKYSEPRGHIRVSAASEGGEVVIRVSDTGIGIAPHLIPTLWDLFTQVRDTLDKAQGGLGIGLSLVKNLVELHAGTVAAESEGIGHGSAFTVRLPLAAADDQSAARSAPRSGTAAAPRTPRRVLVVDDSVDAAELLSMLLEISGHTTATAHSGLAALETARTFAPDIVLLDIGLPDGMDGYEVARQFRADPQTAKLVLVALTGWGSEGDKRMSKDAGFDHHLVKPVEADSVEAVIARLCVMPH